MREFTAPGGVAVEPDDNVVAALFARAETEPSRPALASRSGDAFHPRSTAETVDTIRRLAAGLIALGIEPGSRVAIFSPSRIEFTLLDYAIWAAGCATVTIYESSSAEQVEWILGNSESVALICGDESMRRTYESVADGLPACEHIFVIDTGALDELERLGADVTDEHVDDRVRGITHDDLATLVYTSGTTGRPKGCELTHGNLIWEVRQVLVILDELFRPGDTTLMFLPLAHVLARLVQFASLTRGVTIGYSTGIKNLVEEMGLFAPTFVVSVPRVFEKVFNTARSQAEAGGGAKTKIFDRAVEVAITYSRQRHTGTVPFAIRIQHRLFDRLVYGKLRAVFGGKLRFAISGGAPLGDRLGHFFDGVGVLVLEGYGLTETSAAATLNHPGAVRIGSVGQPIPGAGARIAEDGEILLRGGHVFRGYWRNRGATAEALEPDGWFHTGDLGQIDTDGFVTITGRKKDLIVTAAGKNVAPAVLEDRIRAHPLVSQAVVLGDGQPFIAALVTLDPEELPTWAERHGKDLAPGGEPTEDLLDDPDLRAEIQGAIDEANRAVSRAESIREFRILPGDFTAESGELTPTLKVKRAVVLDRHADSIRDIYGTG